MEIFKWLKKKRLHINWEAIFNEITVMQVFKSGWWLGESSRWSQELEYGNSMTYCVRDSRQRPPAEHDTGYKNRYYPEVLLSWSSEALQGMLMKAPKINKGDAKTKQKFIFCSTFL